MKDFDYESTIKLKHYESPAKINKQTGEVSEIETKKKVNNIPKDKILCNINNFTKLNCNVFPKLKALGLLTMEEIGIVSYMCSIAEFNTNSLKPLNNETTLQDLADTFDIGKNRVKKVFDKLFNLGVYAQFKIAENGTKEYWILNPNISWKGKLVTDSIFKQFEKCTISKLFNV